MICIDLIVQNEVLDDQDFKCLENNLHIFIFRGPSALPYKSANNTVNRKCNKRSDREYVQVLESFLKMG